MTNWIVFMAAAAFLAIATTAFAGDAVVDDQPRLGGTDVQDSCELYGSGYKRVAGTSTCVKIGGRIRFDQSFNGSPHNDRGGSTLSIQTRSDP